ncbi:MAG TPA: hypothetical protein VNC50_21475, partial [Planctomycetia bacterium]|nr:hypothetical protein [Planctomycetia bacterium]
MRSGDPDPIKLFLEQLADPESRLSKALKKKFLEWLAAEVDAPKSALNKGLARNVGTDKHVLRVAVAAAAAGEVQEAKPAKDSKLVTTLAGHVKGAGALHDEVTRAAVAAVADAEPDKNSKLA